MSPAAIYRRRLCVGRTKFFKNFFILLGFLVERPKSADHDRTELDSCVCVCGAVRTAGPIDRLAALASVGG